MSAFYLTMLSVINCIGSSEGTVVNYELEKHVEGCSHSLIEDKTGGTEENHENSIKKVLIRPNFESKIRRVNAGVSLFILVNLCICVIGFRLCDFV